jgi:hypothetical protein
MTEDAIRWAEAVERMRLCLHEAIKDSPGDFPYGFEVTSRAAELDLLYVLSGVEA